MAHPRDPAPPKNVVQPFVKRAELVVSERMGADIATVRRAHSLEARQQAARAFAAEVDEGRASYGGMLGRVWKEAQRTLDAVEADDEMPVAKRVAALRDLAKLMPMLAKAEAIHVARIGGVKVEDMSDSQLERELRHIGKRRRKARTA